MVQVGLELAPARHVTDEMRTAILDAFALADLPRPAWVAMAGDSRTTHPERNIARPSLHLVVTADADRHPADAVTGLAAALSLALGAIRRELPSLPLGLNVHSPGGIVRYAWRLTDAPDALARSLEALPTSDELDQLGAVIGWDDTPGRWIAL